MEPRVFIVIVVYKRLELTKACLLSLRDQSYENYKVVLVDHCSEDEATSGYIKQNMPEVSIIKGTDDMWWTAATNLGIKHIINNLDPDPSRDLILTLNNDLTVPIDYIEQLVKTYADFNEKVVVGSVSLDADQSGLIDFAGCIWDKISTRIRSVFKPGTAYSTIRELGYVNSDLLPGRGTLFPVGLIQQIGYFDEEHFPHYASDYDFSYRAKLNHYKLVVATRAFVKSAVGETGIRFDKNSKAVPSLNFFWKTQTSIKSPINMQTRYNWARKHTRFPFLYFSIDSMRVVFSYLTYSVKYFKTKAV